MSKNTVQQVISYFILFLSGFAGLGYEMAWTRMLSVGLGHEIIAVLAVVSAFFCGMALGAWRLDGMIGRSRRPGRWYAGLELTIGTWSLLLILLIPFANRFTGWLIGVDPSIYRHWFVAFFLPFFLLLPATFAMGATLPAMEHLFSGLRRDSRSVGGLYAANTFGAVAGTLLTIFFIAPVLGFRLTAGILAGLNFLCALWMLLGLARTEIAPISVSSGISNLPDLNRIMGTLFVTGFLGIGYEILVVRIVSQVLENTVYSFASLLSVYLLGTATGAAIYQAIAPHRKFRPVLTFLLHCLALICVIGIFILPFSESIFTSLYHFTGAGTAGAAVGEIGLAASVFFLPTTMMGAIFSHLAQAARKPSGGVGRALAINTLGGAIAPLIFGVILLPAIGSKVCLVTASLVYLLLIPSYRWKLWVPAAIPLSLAVFIFVNHSSLEFISLMPGCHVVKHIEGVMADVSVIEDRQKDYFLKVNNKFVMGGTASVISDQRQGHIPLLLHPNPKSALFLGLGTGATFAAASDYPQLEAQGVELVPEVVDVLPYFEKSTGPIESNIRLKIHTADARRFVNASAQNFDVIVADLFHPARDGAGFLYTVEHFKAIRSLMNPGGVFCQWIPLYQMNLDVLRTITRTFMDVFPNGKGVIATYSLGTPIIGLISHNDDILYPVDLLEKRIKDDRLHRKLAFLRLDNNYTLFGTFIASSNNLKDFAGKGPLNTDDRPVVIFQAPGFVYNRHEPAYERLFTLLSHLNPDPDEILQLNQASNAKDIHDRLKAYWNARNKFLHTGVGIHRTPDVEQMLAQVRDPLLSIVRESPDFEAAYNPLLAMAGQLNRINPESARDLLLALKAAAPLRQDATKLLNQIGVH